jgi:tetratricopeptide (TPR) repeat protein
VEPVMEVNLTPKKSKFPILILFSIITIIVIVVLLVYSALEKREMKEMQELYHTKIESIKSYLRDGNCTEASFEYVNAKKMRDNIVKRGLYYSIEPHSKQAHAIDIAECFSNRKEFENAIEILTIEESNNPDFLIRASVIYKNSGDLSKAQEFKAKAEQFEH